jgi:uncharacterized protein YraI
MLLNVATGVAVAATAVVVFLPAAYAAPGVLTSNVNVRSGPGTNYAVVDTVRRGQQVDVQQCQGSWCFIAKPGPDGWVSGNYLSAGGVGAPVNPTQPGISFGFGPGGPSVTIGGGNQTPPPPPGMNQPPRPPVIAEPSYGEVCFYDRTRFRGDSFCFEQGESARNLGDWADRISSIENSDGLQVQVCSESNYRDCRTYTTSASSLGDFDDLIVSARVR